MPSGPLYITCLARYVFLLYNNIHYTIPQKIYKVVNCIEKLFQEMEKNLNTMQRYCRGLWFVQIENNEFKPLDIVTMEQLGIGVYNALNNVRNTQY